MKTPNPTIQFGIDMKNSIEMNVRSTTYRVGIMLPHLLVENISVICSSWQKHIEIGRRRK